MKELYKIEDAELADLNEKDILLSLNNDIANVRDKKDILKLIHPKIKLLFNTDDIFICALDTLNNTLDPILRVGGANRIKHPDYYRIVNSSFPIHDGFINKILNTNEPLIFNIIKFPKPTEYMKLSKATGLVETLSISLQNAGEVIGILTLWSETKNFFTSHHKMLISKIANNISIIVINILASGTIKKNDKQNEILLSISNEITRIRGKEDLLNIIRNTIRKYIYFDDSFILRYNKESKTCKSYIYHVEKGRLDNPEFGKQLNIEYPINDDDIAAPHIPVVKDVASLLLSGNRAVSFISSAGIVEYVSIKLVEGNELIGLFVLLSERKNSFKPDDLNLLQRISYQLSIATANIIANEEISKREEEKTILLSLSKEIAAVRNKNELLHLLNLKLKELFPITGFGITLINEDCKTHSPFVVDGDDVIRNDIDFKKVIAQRYSVDDGVFNVVTNADEPVTLQVEELAVLIEAPAYVDFWKKKGVKQVVGISVRVGQTNLGCFILLHDQHCTTNINSNLFKSVSAQISLAISNILANEEIVNREREKSILLSVSDEIAALRNRSDLLHVVNTKLKALFSIKEFGIAQINEDGTTYSAFALDLEDNIKNHTDFKRVTSGKYMVNDKIVGSIIQSQDPVLFDVEKCAMEVGMPEFVGFWKAVGLHYVIGMAMRAGGKNIGCAFLHIDTNETAQIKNNLLKSVCAQLAVAVSNILANEKLLDQLNEINKYKQELEEEKIYLKEEIENSHNYSEIIGESVEIKKVFRMVTQVAYSDSTVLILGETGTGKELIARAIHNSSTRKNKLMVKVNCAALPANLIESELFGHERGSFTGAIERRIGKFELANNGTLFLDEIGEMSTDLQVKLLRALQEKEIERVGGKTTIKTDARIIAATNRDLKKLMEEGKFRSDLFYRLNIFPITLPSLKDRREDIPQLVSYFIVRYSKKAGKKINTISNKVLQELIQYDWPGNIRELEHLIERSVLLATGDTIKEIHLPEQKKNLMQLPDYEDVTIRTIDENEKEHILKMLKHVKGRIGGVGGAAELLGIPTSTLNSRIKRLGIKKEHSG